MMAIELQTEQHEPLKVKCDQSDCEHGLHCFRISRKKAKYRPGTCQHCGADLVNWDRIKQRNLSDLVHTFDELKKEWIRHHYFHEPIDPRAHNYALRKGRVGLKLAVPKRIRSSLRPSHPRAGQQTPWTGNIIFYAQHATACCCRRCLEYWHGIPINRDLTDDEVQYFADLCLRVVFERLPDLPDEGQHVAPIRNRRNDASSD